MSQPYQGGPVDKTPATLSFEPAELADVAETHTFAQETTAPYENGAASAAFVQQFGNYELLEEIARGGMGVVYKARQQGLKRLVALKTIQAGEFANADQVQRFQAEAQSVARLNHPGIVPVYEVGICHGTHFFSMQYLAGGSLADRLKGGPLPARDGAVIVRQVAEAVQAAHEQQIIHRDLKPGNILLDELGIPRVADFGLAKQLDSDEGLTQTGDVMGTPGYMAPEQAHGRLDQIGATTDVYALGAILYHVLTGRPPFQGSNKIETLRQVVEQEPVSPRQLNAAIPRDLETIALKCLEKVATKRYRTARELTEELARFLAGEPILAKPTGAIERAVKWTKRNPGGTALIAVGGVALATTAALIVSMVFQSQLRRTNDELDEARIALKGKNDELIGQNAELDRAKTAALNAQAEASKQRDLLARHRYSADMSAAGTAWHVGDIARVEALLARNTPATPNAPDLRGFEWWYLKGLLASEQVRKPGLCAAYSPAGDVLAVSYENRVDLLDAANGTLLRTLEETTSVWHMAFSRDGQRLIGGCSTQPFFRVWNVADGSVVAKYDKHSWSGGVALASDGSLALTTGTSDDRMVRLWKVDTSETLLELHAVSDQALSYPGDVAFSPDGKWFAIGWPINQSVLVGKTEAPQDYVELPLSPNGSSLDFDMESKRLITSRDGSVGWFYLDNLTPQTQFNATTMEGSILDLRSDGRLLATSVDTDKSLRVWDMASGQLLNARRGHIGGYRTFSFRGTTADGVSSGPDQTLRFFNVFDKQEFEPLNVFAWGPSDIAFSPDGVTLAIAASGTLVLFEEGQIRELESPLASSTESTWSVAFSPDGRLFAAAGRRSVSNSFEAVCRVWHVADGKLAHEIVDEKCIAFYEPTFDAKGERLAISGGNGRTRMFEVAHWKPLPDHVSGQGEIFRVRFRPGSDEIATQASNGSILFAGKSSMRGWNVNTNDMAFTADGTGLFVTTNNIEVQLRDVSTGETRTTFSGHQSYVNCLALSSDETRLATASPDGSVKIWDVASGQECLSLPVTAPRAIEFSPDGKQLAVATLAGEVRLYDATLGDLGP